MLLFICHLMIFPSCNLYISKHLMLLFIFAFLSYSSYFLQHFKTSHVIVYRQLRPKENYFIWISKHLMLLFIDDRLHRGFAQGQFQNISCYCLSTLPGLLCGCSLHFKTSHVIVYLNCSCSEFPH